MTTLRPFRCSDLLRFNKINLDPFTETYSLHFYMHYLIRWPEFFQVAESPNGDLMAYIMGKTEGHEEKWHGHVTAVTVAPEYRRIGLARTLMNTLEMLSDAVEARFVDLYVRVSNEVAIEMYRKLGYIVYRQIIDYYSGEKEEDAYDMRKALSADPEKKSMVPIPHPVRLDEDAL